MFKLPSRSESVDKFYDDSALGLTVINIALGDLHTK